jgi:segregation and condensation protein B
MEKIKNILEAALMSAGEPMNVERLQKLVEGDGEASHKELRIILENLKQDYQERAIELVEVASGYRFQVKQEYAIWVGKLWQERPARYSRALLETLALIAYRQPITRGEIEDVRGVAVSQHIIKTLTEREWISVAGHRDVPGRPALYVTTQQFLNDFNLKSLQQLPMLSELQNWELADDSLNTQLSLKITEEEKII